MFQRLHVSEVAVVFENSDGEPPFNQDILVHLHPTSDNGRTTKRISLLYSKLDALTYPLLFPYGEEGWHDNIQQLGVNRRVTQMEYYSYLLSIRASFNPILNAEKLFQQYVVDVYVKVEANRLNFI